MTYSNVARASSLLEVRALRYSYGRHEALRSLTFSAGCGVTVVLGPNGAGKSTLAAILATTRRLQGGDVAIDGQSYGQARGGALRELRRSIGILPQSFGFYPGYSVLEGMRYAAWLREFRPVDLDARLHELVGRVGLNEQRHRRLGQLSGGMLRRFGLAQALVNEPRLVLLDEPTSDLDPEQRARVRGLVADFAEEGRTVLLSTHLLEDVTQLRADVVLMRSGQVLFSGPLDEFCRDEAAQGRLDYAAAENAYLRHLASA